MRTRIMYLQEVHPGLVEIDDDAREEYWREVRGMPERSGDRTYRSTGVHGRYATR
ncbi:MAG: hypothetical protein KIT31_34050 [Deltaproteobacteria bacterium]|nr:hypothetical protein [Deltaproteobacteria bacterium]